MASAGSREHVRDDGGATSVWAHWDANRPEG